MVASIEIIREKFVYFNRLIFHNSLPLLPFKLLKNKSLLGKFQYRKRLFSSSREAVAHCSLGITCLIDMGESLLEDTIIHEMIHYYIYINNIRDDGVHGQQFRHMMAEINERYHRHISISHRYSTEELKQIRSVHKLRLICLVVLRDKRKFVKAVPRIDVRIKQVYQRIKSGYTVEDVQWYFTSDPFFNYLPVSSSIRLYEITDEEIRLYLPKTNIVSASIQKLL